MCKIYNGQLWGRHGLEVTCVHDAQAAQIQIMSFLQINFNQTKQIAKVRKKGQNRVSVMRGKEVKWKTARLEHGGNQSGKTGKKFQL